MFQSPLRSTLQRAVLGGRLLPVLLCIRIFMFICLLYSLFKMPGKIPAVRAVALFGLRHGPLRWLSELLPLHVA